MIIRDPTSDGSKKPRVVVRLKTSCWKSARGLHCEKSLIFLRRKCVDFNFFEEDCTIIDSNEMMKHITNWNEAPDGVYEIILVNVGRDWETNCIEDYDYKLIPYKGE